MAIRVLVVDDSPTMRAMVKHVLNRQPDIEIVGEAGDPYEAREAMKVLSPDVLTLDVEMPRMSGLSFLEKIMRLRPTPVIMVSSLTAKGADSTIEALSLGAIDCVCKPSDGDFQTAYADLPDKIRNAAKAAVGSSKSIGAAKPAPTTVHSNYKPNDRVVAIGASTGGVEALQTLLKQFPANCPPTVIVQHMPGSFTGSFARRLNNNCAPTVTEAQNEMPLRPGHIYLAPGGTSHLKVNGRHRMVCALEEGPAVSGHSPSVDVLFNSVTQLKERAIGILLTGMGRDGATGLGKIKSAGGMTIAQNKATCVVYGMPRLAQEEGAVQHLLPLNEIADLALGLCAA